MGDADIRAAAAVSNRMLERPARAVAKGAFEGTSQVSQSLLDLRKTIEGLDPEKATGVASCWASFPSATNARLLPPLRERAVPPRRDHQGLVHGQDELRKDNAALEQEKMHLWETMQRLASTSTSPSASTPSLTETDRRDRGHRSERGQGAQRRRAVLRPAEAPGSADAARGVDPGLPRDRPRPEEQHRADQGCRPRDDDDDRRAAHGRRRRAGAGEPEARARPDHRAEHHDVEPDRVDVEAAGDARASTINEQAARRRSASTRSRPRSRTSTSRWMRSTRSRSRR